MDFRKFLTLPLAVFVLFAAVPGFAVEVNELERRLDIVSEELDRLKNSSGGSGIANRTTVHGYGETLWKAGTDDGAQVDQHRFVIGVHSEISEWIHLNAEIDFEHAATELEFEFGHLDFLVSQQLNFRAGTMLMPMGNLNEFHEPNNFFTVERPDYHSKLIPTTWQQAEPSPLMVWKFPTYCTRAVRQVFPPGQDLMSNTSKTRRRESIPVRII